ncbi:MAG: hypothetical protein ACLFQK_01880 [Fibrobacterota bacterium]
MSVYNRDNDEIRRRQDIKYRQALSLYEDIMRRIQGGEKLHASEIAWMPAEIKKKIYDEVFKLGLENNIVSDKGGEKKD